ncbi:MAG: DUF5908 family protein [Bacteroidota bacterium]
MPIEIMEMIVRAEVNERSLEAERNQTADSETVQGPSAEEREQMIADQVNDILKRKNER